MAKKSALDYKIAECDREIAAAKDAQSRWEAVRMFLTDSATAQQVAPALGRPAAPKAKRTRGKANGKPGLPVAPNPDDEATRMSVDGR